MIQNLRGSAVKGSWNEMHSVWTTIDGRYKIIRRFPTPEVKAAWVARGSHAIEGVECERFSHARRVVAEQVKRDAGIDVPTIETVK